MDWSAFPLRTWKAAAPLYRIHGADHHPAWFNADGSMRFDPPKAHRGDYGTCYTATSAIAAYVEVIGRLKTAVKPDIIEERRLAVLRCRRGPRLADLTDRSILGGYGIDASVSTGGDYAEAQRIGAELWSAKFDGVLFRVRHDNALTLEAVALFGEPGETPAMFGAPKSAPISDDLIEEGRTVYGIEVTPVPRYLGPHG